MLPALGVQRDAIAANLGYSSSIDFLPGAPKKGFGQTDYKVTGTSSVTVKPGSPGSAGTPPTPGSYEVSGTVKNTITYQLTDLGRKNIASESDPAITQTNYPQVVKDLTPLAAAQGTKFKNEPPRDQFWAEDLTRRHELVHCNQDASLGGPAVTTVQNWLNKQTANDDAQLVALLNTVNDKVKAEIEKGLAHPADEQNAYDKGAPEYLARAQAIKTKGDAKGYAPPAPAPAPTQPAPAPQQPKAPAPAQPAPGQQQPKAPPTPPPAPQQQPKPAPAGGTQSK